MESGKLRILVADDHSIVREGIIKALSVNFPGAEFGEASNAAEVMKKVNESKWSLVILDISMPGRNGMDVLKEIKAAFPEIKVIIFSMHPEDQFAVRAIKAGAAAYLTKDIPTKKLAEAIERILRGERYLTPSLTDLITNEILEPRTKPVHEILSDREYQVFLYIASGKSISDIAAELSLSVKTISVYRANIIKKMKLKNNAEIVHYAFKQNLVS
jgi:two-component system, NarL family, invasion response regulator UvrY